MTAPATKTPPSPTPWRAARENEYVTIIEDANGREIGSFSGGWEDAPDEHARISVNAHAAVLAVNEYEGLVEIARDVAKWPCEDCGRHAPKKCDWCKKVRAILARLDPKHDEVSRG